MKKGDLSKFIEQAVRAHVFHRMVQDIKAPTRTPIRTSCRPRSTIRCGRFARNGRASVAGERVLEVCPTP